MATPQVIRNRMTTCSSNSAPGWTLENIEGSDSKRYLYARVCSNVIHDGWRVDATRGSLRNKQSAVSKHDGIFSVEKEGNPATCDDLAKP